jgi:uncharacterized protein (DUF58 family)
MQARLPLSDTLLLTQRNVYILPTGAGWMLALTLLVLLLASINFQLNLGYLLTFLLAGSAVVGMHMCHGTLRGLTLHLQAARAAVRWATARHAGPCNCPTSAAHRATASRWPCMAAGHWAWTDVPAQGNSQRAGGLCRAPRRGLHRVPT